MTTTPPVSALTSLEQVRLNVGAVDRALMTAEEALVRIDEAARAALPLAEKEAEVRATMLEALREAEAALKRHIPEAHGIRRHPNPEFEIVEKVEQAILAAKEPQP